MISCSRSGSSGLIVTGATGVLFRMAARMTADVFPGNGCRPVAPS